MLAYFSTYGCKARWPCSWLFQSTFHHGPKPTAWWRALCWLSRLPGEDYSQAELRSWSLPLMLLVFQHLTLLILGMVLWRFPVKLLRRSRSKQIVPSDDVLHDSAPQGRLLQQQGSELQIRKGKSKNLCFSKAYFSEDTAGFTGCCCCQEWARWIWLCLGKQVRCVH